MGNKSDEIKFDKVCRQIKEVKIQGAENVARAAIKALAFKHDSSAIKKLISLRPTEPCLRNSIKFVMTHMDIKEGILDALKHFDYSQARISEFGARLIKNRMKIFTFCHSATVMGILKLAKKQGKNFEVLQTETRPLFQGRITARELAKARIKVTHFVDSASRIALKNSDIMIIGCDAITSTRIYNKVGSEMMAIIANKYDVPVFIATDSWKFDPDSIYGREELIEERDISEIWKNPPRGVKIKNLAFEAINPDLIDGIITELGIFMNKSLISAIQKNYPWMFF